MAAKPSDQTKKVLAHLSGWGFPPEIQQRIGALAVVWGVFETTLEPTLWALRDEQVRGIRPSTDKTSIGQWIDALGKDSGKLGAEVQEILNFAAAAANDLMQYRHALVHGWMLPSSTMPIYIRNPSWSGEVRKRPVSDAYISENLLDMAIDVAWTLCRVVDATRKACSGGQKSETLTALRNEVLRAKSEANELRHLTVLMNDEKY